MVACSPQDEAIPTGVVPGTRHFLVSEGYVGRGGDWFVNGFLHIHRDDLDVDDELTARAVMANEQLTIFVTGSNGFSHSTLRLRFDVADRELRSFEGRVWNIMDFGPPFDSSAEVEQGTFRYEWRDERRIALDFRAFASTSSYALGKLTLDVE